MLSVAGIWKHSFDLSYPVNVGTWHIVVDAFVSSAIKQTNVANFTGFQMPSKCTFQFEEFSFCSRKFENFIQLQFLFLLLPHLCFKTNILIILILRIICNELLRNAVQYYIRKSSYNSRVAVESFVETLKCL